ncbi:MAG: hypothetical protein JNL45_09320 [Hyphomicrobium sp.]|nr:hypothetical protein [Hyphomicrobium sp.]
MTPTRDKFGDIIPHDCFGSEPEDVEACHALEEVCLEHGFLEYTRDPATGEILQDARGCNRWILKLPPPEAPGNIAGVVRSEPKDPADAALAKLPIASSKRTRAAALLMIGMRQCDIIAKLRVSASLVSQARAAIIAEYDQKLANGESPAPLHEAITNPGGFARRGQPRPDMQNDGPSSPMAKRAADLGVSVSEARLLASDAGRIAKYGERPKDLKAAAKAREWRARKKAERGE